jgi:hypothetical protein
MVAFFNLCEPFVGIYLPLHCAYADADSAAAFRRIRSSSLNTAIRSPMAYVLSKSVLESDKSLPTAPSQHSLLMDCETRLVAFIHD